MSKIAELQQNYQDLGIKYDEEYGDVEFEDLNKDGCDLLIKRLEAELKLKEATINTRTFNRLHKPVILHRISRVKIHIENQKWLQSKVKA